MSQEWQFRCGKCGFKKLMSETGKGTRVGAGNKRVLGWCPTCNWFRMLYLELVETVSGSKTKENE